MKLEKKHYIIIGVIAIVLIWYFLFRKKKENSLAKVSSNLQGRAYIPGQAPGFIKPTGKGSGIDTTAVQDAAENSFRGGRGFGGFHHRGHRFYPGSGGWLGWGYPVPYGYYDVYDPIAVTTTECPKGWIWMGAMLGCQKPQGI